MIEPLPAKLENALVTVVSPDETVLIKLRGTYQEALICTSTRVIILKRGWMTGQLFGTNLFQCPYSNVSGAQVNFHLVTGYFQLSAGGMQNTPKSFWNSDKDLNAAKAPNCVSIAGADRAAAFRRACAFIMERANRRGSKINNDELEVLKRLAQLRDEGVISAPEFETKKAQILSRL